MKKLLIFLLMVVCITISGCNNKTSVDDKNISSPIQQTSHSGNKPNEQTSTRPEVTASVELESTQTVSTTKNDIKQIDASDFIVTDGSNSIKLDAAFKDFKINTPEKKLDNNYVGETTSGEYVYKTYMHKYADFDLYVSNLNYNLKNRNFDEYYITQITLKDSNFKTARGITIGSKLENVNAAYGSVEKSTVDGRETLSYKLNDMELLFTLDENQKVQEVVLMVNTENP